jgi:hypothetical protein
VVLLLPAAEVSPAGQATHREDVSLSQLPSTHMHCEADVDPSTELERDGHAEHVPFPVLVLYVPASHAVHDTPSEAAVYPARQMHSTLHGVELVPLGHTEHVPFPGLVLNVPAPHAVHDAPFESGVYPARQKQYVAALLLAAELDPAGHAAHTRVPLLVVYVPASPFSLSRRLESRSPRFARQNHETFEAQAFHTRLPKHPV